MRRAGGKREGDAVRDATQINTAIPLVVKSENYADRLARWMEDEEQREQDAQANRLTAAACEKILGYGEAK